MRRMVRYAHGPMISPSLPFSRPGCAVDAILVVDAKLRIVAHATSASAPCPRCYQPSTHVHSHYLRTVRDLPMSDWTVSLVLEVRRFHCRQPDCPQRSCSHSPKGWRKKTQVFALRSASHGAPAKSKGR